MKYARLKKLIDNMWGSTRDICENTLECFDEDVDITYDDFVDALHQECDSYFTYYIDAWDYLQDNQITDFNDAIQEWGVTDICGIACYYAEHDACEEVWSLWDTYEEAEDEDIDEWDYHDDDSTEAL